MKLEEGQTNEECYFIFYKNLTPLLYSQEVSWRKQHPLYRKGLYKGSRSPAGNGSKKCRWGSSLFDWR
jgi:hypothetical protein